MRTIGLQLREQAGGVVVAPTQQQRDRHVLAQLWRPRLGGQRVQARAGQTASASLENERGLHSCSRSTNGACEHVAVCVAVWLATERLPQRLPCPRAAQPRRGRS